MHPNILTQKQRQLLPLIKEFSQDFYLVGGTAIALYIDHRRSIDFDLFSRKALNKRLIHSLIERSDYKWELLFEREDQLSGILHQVRLTFYQYPFAIPASTKFENIIKMPSLLDLAAMKAYALGQRAKWKDYVDLYFIFKDHYSLDQIVVRAREVFGPAFNGKLFRQQIAYFEDINYQEKVAYLGPKISRVKIQHFLTKIATEKF